MAGKTVPESMGRCTFRDFSPLYCPFDCFLDMGLMEIIASVFIFVRNECQRLWRTKPLPGEFPGSIFILFLNPVRKKSTGLPRSEIFLMQIYHGFEMIFEFRNNFFRQRNRTIFSALPSWTVNIPVSKLTSLIRSCIHSNKRRPQPYKSFAINPKGYESLEITSVYLFPGNSGFT